MRLGLLSQIIHETFYTGEAVEVFFHVHLCCGALNAKITRQTKCAHAIDQAEVDHLRGAALLGLHLIQTDTKNLCGSRAVNILT